MKKRIAFCVPTMVIGGVETVLVNTVEKLLECDDLDLCLVFHTDVIEPKYKDWLKSHPEIPVYVYYPLGNWFEKQKKRFKKFPCKLLCRLCYGIYKNYRRFIMRFWGGLNNVDVFVDYKMFDFAKELRWFKARKIVWVHINVKYLLENNRAKKIKQYSTVVGLTDAFVDEFKSVFPEYADRVVRIYNPIDVDRILDLSKVNMPTVGADYFVTVSRLDGYQKDVKTLIDAFDLFYEKNDMPDVKLVIIGGGVQENYLKNYAENLKSGKNIVFTGALNNPFVYMKNAICNILSSNFEGLPTVLIEAQSLGVLNVAADCEYGPKEIFLGGKAGVLFKIADVQQLANIMTDVYNKKLPVSEMVLNATNALGRFETNTIKQQICEVLNG